MGIPLIMGWEGGFPIQLYKDSGWIAWCADWHGDGYPTGKHLTGSEGDIDPAHTSGGQINGSVPTGGGQRALKMSSGNGKFREFFSPANLMDKKPYGSGVGSSLATNGRGLEKLGIRFFWKVPSVKTLKTPIGVRLWDGKLGRHYIDSTTTEFNDYSSPLFNLCFTNAGSAQTGYGFELLEGSGNTSTATVWETSTTAPLIPGEWVQIAMHIELAKGGNKGLIHIYIDGVIALQYDPSGVEPSVEFADAGGENPSPVQGMEYFSFINVNKSYGGGILQAFDNIVVYDYWDKVGGNAENNTPNLIVQNQVIQGLFVQEEGANAYGSWARPGGGDEEPAIQGTVASTVVTGPPDDNIAYNESGDSYLKTTTTPDIFEVDVWNSDRVLTGGSWTTKAEDPLAIRVVAVAKGDAVESAQVFIRAKPTLNAAASGELGDTHSIASDYNIIQTTWDSNPDGGGDGVAGAFDFASVNLLKIGLKIS